MRNLKLLAGFVLAIGVAVAAVVGAARLHDGPLGPIPGGPLVGGQLVSSPVADWSFAKEVETIELQLDGEDTSRTTWIVVSDGRAFIPCSLGFPPGKSWHLRADRDGDAIVRVLGKRHEVSLERVESPGLGAELEEIATEKYEGGPPGDSEVWFFAIDSREAG